MYVPVIPPSPSAEAKELGGLIAQVVQDYRAANPEMSSEDVRQALTVAREEVCTGSRCATRLVAFLIAGLAALALGLLFFFKKSAGGGPPIGMAWVGIAAVAGLLVTTFAVFLARRA